MALACIKQSGSNDFDCSAISSEGISRRYFAEIILLDLDNVDSHSVDVTNKTIIDSLVKKAGTQAYKWTFPNDRVILTESTVTVSGIQLLQYVVTFPTLDNTPTQRLNLENLLNSRVLAILTNYYTGTAIDSKYEVVGYFEGLTVSFEKTKGDVTNENNGVQIVTLTSTEQGQGKAKFFYDTDAITTEAAITALTTA